MNIRKTFYFLTLIALFAVAVAGYLLVPSINSSGTVSAQETISAGDGERATPEMLRYALDFKSDDMSKSFSALKQLPCTTIGTTELGGKSFRAGVYCLDSAQLAGQLVVDAENDPSAIFIFRIAGSLNTKSGSSVALANDAQAANVFFVTDEAATIKSGTNFKGSILSHKSITVEEGATVKGRTFTLNGDVRAPEGATGGGTGTLQICKQIDEGNPAAASILGSTFQFQVTGVPGTINIGPITQLGAVGRLCTGAIDVPAGPQTVRELATRTNAAGTTVTGGFELFDIDLLSQPVPGGTTGSTIVAGTENLPLRQVGVNIVEGGIAGQLSLLFQNRAAVTGFVEICKLAATTGGVADADVTGFFTFRIETVFAQPGGTVLQEFVVPVGQCTNAIQVITPFGTAATGAGDVFVSELPRTGFFLEDIFTIPAARELGQFLGTCLNSTGGFAPCAGGGSALVQVLQGGAAGTNAANETIVNFVNRAAPGLVKVCKIAGPGVTEGTVFRFNVTGTGAVLVPAQVGPPPVPAFINPTGAVNAVVDVPAGPAATGGTCVFVPGTGGTGDQAGLQTFLGGSTVTVVEVGALAGTGNAAAGAAGTVVQTLNTGEAIRTARIRTSSVFVQPSPFAPLPNPDLTPVAAVRISRAAVVARAGVVEVEFVNFAFFPTLLKVCKIAGPGVAVGTPFTFDVATVSPTTTGGVIGGVNPIFTPFTTSVTVSAGPAVQGGNCAFVGGLPGTVIPGLPGGAFDIGSTVTITERAAGTTQVTGITSSTSPTIATLTTAGGGLFTGVVPSSRTATLTGAAGLVAGANIVTFTNAVTTTPPIDMKPFDFDGDGKSDTSVFRRNNNVWYMMGESSGLQALQFGSSATDKIVPADYDGDFKADVAVYRNGMWYIQRSKDGFIGTDFGLSTDVPVPADYDGDGKADVAVFRPSNGTWYIQQSRDGFKGVQFGQVGDIAVPADYDGDKKADIAVFRPSAGAWYRINSSTGQWSSIQFGMTGDKPVAADYDGDGKADIAVFRPSNGTWYALKSKDGFAGFQFGIASDIPVAADYDGDGKSDMAVYRSGTWYIQQSRDGFKGVAFGTATDMPIPAWLLQ